MPNHVTNILTVVDGSTKEVFDKIMVPKRLKYPEDESCKDNNELSLDFNTIVPMPLTLKLISGSSENDAIAAYLFKNVISMDDIKATLPASVAESAVWGDLFGAFTRRTIKDQNEYDEMVKRYVGKWDNGNDKDHNTEVEFLALGKQYVDNLREHGATTWYGWCNENWGTKWNAYECYFDEDSDYVEFDTAWACPYPVIEQLSRMFPEHTFQIKYADEDTAYNCGKITYKNGETLDEFIPEGGSKEAFEIYFDVKGDNEDYVYDEAKGTYVYVDEDEVVVEKPIDDDKLPFE